MEQNKRQRNSNFDEHGLIPIKKIRNEAYDGFRKKPVTNFENLSNEIIYEIFDYLDNFYVYKAFLSLNQRFYNVIMNTDLPLNIDASSMSKSSYEQYYNDIIATNLHRIKSLSVSNLFMYELTCLSPLQFLSNYHQLERLGLYNIPSKYLENLIIKLMSLPNLSSLTIDSVDRMKQKTNLCHKIFHLPALKYCKLSLKAFSEDDLLPPIANYRSSIEYLVIKDALYSDQIYSLLTNFPQIRRLSIQLRAEYWRLRSKIDPPKLNYLTHVFLKLDAVNFDQFEQLANDLFNKVQVLHISISHSHDILYTNSQRWERLILSHMPALRIFDIQHENWPTNNNDNNDSYGVDDPINQFTSPFWIKRGWFFGLQSRRSFYTNARLFYSIDSYRRKSYGLYKELSSSTCVNSLETNLRSVQHIYINHKNELANCRYYFPNATKLTFSSSIAVNHNSVSSFLNGIMPLNQISTISLKCTHVPFVNLIELLLYMPNVCTLKFETMPLYGNSTDFIRDKAVFRLVANQNKITTVVFKQRCTLEKIRLLVDLCPRIENLSIKLHARDLQSISQFLLENNNMNSGHLYSLCILSANAIWKERLAELIQSKTLIHNYMIEYISSNLYLWL